MNFAIYYAGDAYSTDNKIMGRQSAGKSFMKGVARSWPEGTIRGVGTGTQATGAMLRQLQADGFRGRFLASSLPDLGPALEAGALYYPAPPSRDIISARNTLHPGGFSILGVTHTLASAGSTDLIADMVLPPFTPCDALICTSEAARAFVSRLHEDMRHYWREHLGATRFVNVKLPVIPLGVDMPAFVSRPGTREPARQALPVSGEAVVFLFAGRLSFHAKANPAPVYQALEEAARHVPVVCVEAGVFPNKAIREGFAKAQQALAPSVRFLWIDGNDETRYRQAWQAADVFVSLSDNIQETFGLTPVEAMAAGLPVVISDWNGYKDTVRDGVDGFRIPTVLPPAGAGMDYALRHGLAADTYDYYIGAASLATVIDPAALAQALARLATDPDLRRAMGEAGRARAHTLFDWPVILKRYSTLAEGLAGERRALQGVSPSVWPQRADPFHRFAHYATATLGGSWTVHPRPGAASRLKTLLSLQMTSYALGPRLLPMETIEAVLAASERGGPITVNALLASAACATPAGVRALMWLWKFDLVGVRPPRPGETPRGGAG